jgi:hypothetical protein
MPRGDLTDAVLRLDDDRDSRDQIPVDMMRDRQRRFSQEGRRAGARSGEIESTSNPLGAFLSPHPDRM